MSHVNPEKAVANQLMGKMDMGSMMEGMAPMKMEGMMPMMMKEGMGPMMKMPGAATGVVVYTGYRTGESAIRKIFTHPLVIFSLGAVVGCYVYRYRKSIISCCAKPKEE